jgi:hypothetical protein
MKQYKVMAQIPGFPPMVLDETVSFKWAELLTREYREALTGCSVYFRK